VACISCKARRPALVAAQKASLAQKLADAEEAAFDEVRAFFVKEGKLNEEQTDEIMIALTDPEWKVTSLPVLFAMSDEELMECFEDVSPFSVKKLAVKAVEAKKRTSKLVELGSTLFFSLLSLAVSLFFIWFSFLQDVVGNARPQKTWF